MQNHLENSVVRGGGSYANMLTSGSDPCFGGGGGTNSGGGNNNGGDFMNGSSPGSDYTHLLNHNHGHPGHPHTQPHHHHAETNNNNTVTNHQSNNNNNNQTNQTNNNSSTKPKKPPPPNGKKTKGRVKIKMEFIDNKLRRYTTFSKRKTGIMKKAYELSTLTGTQVMLLVASETGHVYTFATRKLQPMITSEAGKALIQTCLNSPDPPNSGSDSQRMSATGYEETELTYAADPNASDHGDTKDDESETTSSDADETNRDVPPLLPLANGLSLPTNFATLFASASAAGFPGTKLASLAQDGSSLVGGGSSNRSITITPSAHQQNRGASPSNLLATPSISKSLKIKRELSN